jgi:hypothetical protein
MWEIGVISARECHQNHRVVEMHVPTEWTSNLNEEQIPYGGGGASSIFAEDA